MYKPLRKDEIKELEKEIKEAFNIEIKLRKRFVQIIARKFERIILVDKTPYFFYYNNRLVPSLKFCLSYECLASVKVDMGAIKFIINGADVMRPGIVDYEEFNKDDFVVIRDIQHNKPIAIGLALYDSNKLKAVSSGKVIKNLHYVGDELWKLNENQ